MSSACGLEAFSWSAAAVKEEAQKASEQFVQDGLLHVRGLLDGEVAGALESHVERELAARRAEGNDYWFGNVYGSEIQGKRWDLKLELCPEVTAALQKLLGNLQALLEHKRKGSWKLTELAAMCTLPGDSGQPVHADTSHMEEHAIVTVFVALHDIQKQRGPTCMHPGTHSDEELHMGLKILDEKAGVLCTMQCGDCVVMDSRLLHRGTANLSENHRYLFYCSWAPEESTSRSSTNTIFDSYRDCLILQRWRQWLTDPPPNVVPAIAPDLKSSEVKRKTTKHCGKSEQSQALDNKRRRLWKGAQLQCLGQQQKIRTFLSWLHAHNIDLQAGGVELRVSARDGIGVFAVRRIHPGETFVRVPMAAVLHAGKVSASDFGQKVCRTLNAKGLNITPEELLWLYMIWGREETTDCPWYGYLQSLPSKDPMLWVTRDSALRWLKGMPLLEATTKELDRQRCRHQAIVEELCSSCGDVFSMSRFSFSNWLWARSCYLSRAFQRSSFPNDCLAAGCESDFLCPVLDAANHMPQAQVEWRFGVDSTAFVLPLSAAAYESGKEVFNLYGPTLSNEDLLSHYGFAIRKNTHDAISNLVIKLPSGTADSRLGELASAIHTISAKVEGDALNVTLTQPLKRDMLETPCELLRVASLLILRRDYDEDNATCSDKFDALKATAKMLRGVRSHLAPLSMFSQHPVTSATRVQLPAKSSVEHATAVYAWEYRSILQAAISCATAEAEMAELAAQMNSREESADENDLGCEQAESAED